MFRCDLPQDERTGPGFLFPAARVAAIDSLDDRRAAAARLFTDPRLGRMPRTLVNRVWQRLLGRGIVANSTRWTASRGARSCSTGSPRLRGAPLRHQAPDRDHRDVAGVPVAGGTARGRAAGTRLRVPRARGAAADGGAVRRRHRVDHRRVEHRAVPAAAARLAPPRSGGAAALDADRGRRSGTRMADAVDDADARPRPADPRPGHLHARRRRDDAAGAGADQRRGAHALAGAGRGRMLGELPADPFSRYTAHRRRPDAAPSGFDIDVIG